MGFIGVFSPEEVEVTGDSAVKIWGYPYPDGDDAIVQRFTQRYRVLPLRVRWGGRLNLTSRCPRETSTKHVAQSSCSRWSLLSGGQWTQWSSRTEGAERGKDTPSGWVDQWEVSSGLSRETAMMGWGADLRWRPTPVPEQSGRSSYVDPSQLALALSARWSITSSLSWQISAQAHWLLPRVDEKDQRALDPVRDEFPASVDELSGEPITSSGGLQSNNPGFPGYESGGMVWSGGVSLTWRDAPDESL